MKTKICKKCGKELPLDEFYKHPQMKDGHVNVCKECFLKRSKQYNLEHKEDIAEYQKQYYADHKEEMLEHQKQYNADHKEEIRGKARQTYLLNRENILTKNRNRMNEVRKTQIGRAKHQIDGYKSMDKNRGFGNAIDFDAQWIVENIYTKPCVYCGETDWHKLGCNRLDNSKPHTKDNVESCCKRCNSRLGREFQLSI